ncbi:protein-L-isoaspartate(D-aspartate) O-methyltransferase [Flavobacteriaceae bacterium]|nr:protein-L-isoaspartate(D-aspartate) O-methyltransferase [Flavobacteriaceae bacterium]
MEDNFKFIGRRRILALELKKKGIINDKILDSIKNIPRHLFIDPGLSEQAYLDKALPIENNQTISQPFTVAFQTQLLDLDEGSKVLEIGTGSGYQTSILNHLKLNIYTIERNHNLFRTTTKLFKKLKIFPKKFIYGDGYNGLKDDSPFDGIIVTAASPTTPNKLLSQLKIGGKMIIPIGKETQVMTRITRISESEFKKEKYGNFKFVPMLENKD